MTRITHVTRAELEAEKAEILAKFPQLANFQPEDECFACATEEVRMNLGHDAADAYGRLDTIAFLLGGDE